jgi:UPF0755 protein
MNPSELPPVDLTKPLVIANKPLWKRFWFVALLIALVFAVGSLIYGTTALLAVDSSDTDGVRFVVNPGESATEIAKSLHEAGLIQDPFVFQLYTQLTGTKSQLQAGGYILKKSMPVAEIIEHISSGKTDEIVVTILPGLTLEQLADPDVKGSLAQQGFSPNEIKNAYSDTYTGVLFETKPAQRTLEGYLYPETYKLMANDRLQRIIQMSLDEMYNQIVAKGLEAKVTQQGLSIHDSIILASIIQKEVADPVEQKQVAQVFLKRLKEGIVLGSDVTFMYIAEKEGREPSVNDDSPYNTRKHGGLPPGAISNFNLSALQAIADPSPGDFLYFVAGDDGTTHFARTEAEHESNVAKYCTVLCQ